MIQRNLRELFQEGNDSRFVEVYGSLLDPDQRKELLKEGGKMINILFANRGW